ncbi:Ferric-uptake regulator [Syntrophomonas zehnderi OL-4]|uniref:Ferric-uptake regulator n=1 Tax=Syntrophomonas zehnderi OL-4 TaxID=690567 RepID=A0A0E3W2W7_9FIRM|nr:transcriptional repressor [Syntrophomonas zehnderi]CFX27403.1 Ferric-uptake regulator [Syntrophomonas zehnderi OL-4]
MPGDHKPKTANGKIVRSTKQRQAILDILTKQQSHLSAEEIYQAVKITQPRISLGTVYRNLEILTELGSIYRNSFADGKARYESATIGHHHHLVCINCQDIENLTACPMAQDIGNLAQSHDFEPLEHYFEVYGYCGKCRRKD